MNRSSRAWRTLRANGPLSRLAITWELHVLSQYSVWIAMLVYAYDRDGATTAALVAVAQLVPAVLVAPLFAAWADRGPVRVLVVGYALQTLGMAVTAAALLTDGPARVAYAGAVVASAAVTATRPAQSALTPGLVRTAEELTVFNAVVGWLDNLGIMAAGALTGIGLALGGPGLVFAAGAVMTTLAAALLLGITAPLAGIESDTGPSSALRSIREGLDVLRGHRGARLLVSLIAAEHVVIGALDLLFVVLAIDVLSQGPEWTGYLNTAYGVGGVAAALVTVALIGRRLATPLVVAGLLVGVTLSLTALSRDVPLTMALVGLVGLGRAVIDVVARTLLQRSVSPDLLARVFGLTEALSMAGLAVGSLLVPLLGQVGTGAALLGVGLLIPLVLAVSIRSLRILEAGATVPVVEIALLRSMPHFRALPTPELEGLARTVHRQVREDGEELMTQGAPGSDFMAISEGEVEIYVDGWSRGTRGPPEGLGEIALLRASPRTATVVARGPVEVYVLDGATFLSVVSGHDATTRRASSEAERRLEADRPDRDAPR